MEASEFLKADKCSIVEKIKPKLRSFIHNELVLRDMNRTCNSSKESVDCELVIFFAKFNIVLNNSCINNFEKCKGIKFNDYCKTDFTLNQANECFHYNKYSLLLLLFVIFK